MKFTRIATMHQKPRYHRDAISRRDWLKLLSAAGLVGTGYPGAEATINRLLLEFYKSPNNGRQVATLSDGRRVLLVHSEVAGPCQIELWRERETGAKRLGRYERVSQTVGPSGIQGAEKTGFGGCCIWHDDRLLVAWTADEGIASANARFDEKTVRWSPAENLLRGQYLLGDLIPCHVPIATWHCTHSRNEESVGIVSLTGDRQQHELQRGRPMFAPVADCDTDGRLHLIWHDVVGQLWYAVIDRLGAKPQVEKIGPGKQPAIVMTPDHVLIVCETVEGAYGHLNWYARNRQTGEWIRNVPLTVRSKWLSSDEIHSPAVTLDEHGVPWLFFANNTRRSVFQARWLGGEWSNITNGPRIFFRPPHFDFNLLPVSRLCVEKRGVGFQPASNDEDTADYKPAPQQIGSTSDIGILMSCEPPIRHVSFRTVDVPKLSTRPGHRTLFLDMQEFARVDNLRLQVETAVKHSANPLMELGPAGAFDEDRVFNHGCVLHDDGKYRMWYGGIREPRRGEPRTAWYDWIKCGYAESDNGIDWRRVVVNQVVWNGSMKNNILPYFRHAPLLYRDDAEPDPDRRYKGFYFWNSAEHAEIARTGKYGRKYDPRDECFLMDLLTSPDGIHWTRQEGEVRFPDRQVKPLSAIPQSVFRDAAEPDRKKRFKAYGFMSLNVRRRGTCCLTSPDALQWTAHPEMPLIDPAVRGMPPAVGGPTGQVHDTVCFPYAGYYLALYQDQQEPRHMPVELAVSRDSETFRHVLPGQRVIPTGAADAFDALTILPTTPIILDDEIRLYYGGGSESIGRDGVRRWRALPGLATLRRDGFTSVSVRDTKRPGMLQTIPFRLRRSPKLVVNANCPRGAALRVELADAATGRRVPGFTRADCHPVERDHIGEVVTWKTHKTLSEQAMAAHECVVLRFLLHDPHGEAKLYSFRFGHQSNGRT